MLAPAITDEIEDALRRQAFAARRLVLVSPPSARKRGRCVYRVDLADGRTLKARRLESAAAARHLVALRAGIDAAFAPVVARHDAVLLEAWIEGTLLTALDPEARAAEAGALLARLHATTVATAATALDVGALRDRARAELGTVAATGKITAAERASLARLLERHPPSVAASVLVHRDFCAENMLVDPQGRMHVIDNEWLDVAAAPDDVLEDPS